MDLRRQRQPTTPTSRPRRVSYNISGVLEGGAAHVIYKKKLDITKIRNYDSTRYSNTNNTKKHERQKQNATNTITEKHHTAAYLQAYSILQQHGPPLTHPPFSPVPAGTTRPPAATAEATHAEQTNHNQQKRKQRVRFSGVVLTCQGCSQSRQSGMAPTHAPTAQPAAGTIAPSSCTAGLTRENVWKSQARG